MPVLAANLGGTRDPRLVAIYVAACRERDRLRMQRFAMRFAPRLALELLPRAAFRRRGCGL